MDRERTSLVKSKSSNNGKQFKTAKKDKKSISDGDFTPNLVKKQATCDKFSNMALRSQEAYKVKNKPPPRPRPGQKKFLSSVLTILSKSTTGTQHPDVQEHTNTRTSKQTQSRFKSRRDNKTDKFKQDRYKSITLNRNHEDDRLIILQSKKDIAQTPSNYSETNADKDYQTDKHTKLSIKYIINNNNCNEMPNGIANFILEDETVQREKETRIKDDPETLISKITERDKQLYNLFVDLFQNTLKDHELKDVLSESNTALRINKSVANKLAINNDESNYLTLDTTTENPAKGQQDVFYKPSNNKPLKLINPNVSDKSFGHTNKIVIPQIYSIHRKRKTIKNSRKRTLLNMFKEELQLKPTFEEPSNIYQALKVMAKGKKTKNVNETPNNLKHDYDNTKCVLKRRKVISMKAKKITKALDRGEVFQKHSDYNSNVDKGRTRLMPSNHSLKVYEYNYEAPEKRGSPHRHEHQNENLAKSPPILTQSNLDYYTLLKFPDRSTYDFTY